MSTTTTQKLPGEPIVIHTVSGNIAEMSDKEQRYKDTPAPQNNAWACIILPLSFSS
jgi:hypothetical protein